MKMKQSRTLVVHMTPPEPSGSMRRGVWLALPPARKIDADGEVAEVANRSLLTTKLLSREHGSHGSQGSASAS